MKKIRMMLLPQGTALITTTKHFESSEGYFEKTDYMPTLKRYRKKWTKQELKTLFFDLNFKILHESENIDNKNKTWMNFVIQKC